MKSKQHIVDLLKKIRVQTKLIEGGYITFSILETTFEDDWSEHITDSDKMCSLRKIHESKTIFILCVAAPKGTKFFRNVCADADATYRVSVGKLHELVIGTEIDADNNCTISKGVLHEIEVVEDTIFTITYTNII